MTQIPAVRPNQFSADLCSQPVHKPTNIFSPMPINFKMDRIEDEPTIPY